MAGPNYLDYLGEVREDMRGHGRRMRTLSVLCACLVGLGFLAFVLGFFLFLNTAAFSWMMGGAAILFLAGAGIGLGFRKSTSAANMLLWMIEQVEAVSSIPLEEINLGADLSLEQRRVIVESLLRKGNLADYELKEDRLVRKA